VLASATVTNSDPSGGSPVSFFSHAIPAISLAANATYYIVQDFAAATRAHLHQRF
jgi:hypothetical protein